MLREPPLSNLGSVQSLVLEAPSLLLLLRLPRLWGRRGGSLAQVLGLGESGGWQGGLGQGWRSFLLSLRCNLTLWDGGQAGNLVLVVLEDELDGVRVIARYGVP